MIYKSNGEIGPTPLSRHCGQVERPTSNVEWDMGKNRGKNSGQEFYFFFSHFASLLSDAGFFFLLLHHCCHVFCSSQDFL